MRYLHWPLCAALVAVAAGCGGEKLAPVSGVVTLDGAPLADASVTFQPVAQGGIDAGSGSYAKTDAEGRYTLRTVTGDRRGAVVGKHVVRISQYEQIKGLQKYIGHEPAVPMIYLASEQEPRTQNDYQSPEYDARIIPAQKAFVDRFAPGEFRWIDAPHWMEPVVPDQIAQAVRDVVALAAG